AVLSWIFSQLLTPHGQIANFCSARMMPELVTEFSKYFENRFTEVWLKPSAMVLHKDRPRPDIEFICVFHRKRTPKKYRTYNWEEVAIKGEPFLRKNQNLDHTNITTSKREIDENESGLRHPSSVVRFPNRPAMKGKEARSARHPTQKSLEHMKRLIKILSNPGETVLDPFMGSGTATLAAIITGREAIGFEIESQYFEMAQERIALNTAQRILL
ncbi:MAG: site-specific DNA-methyltransferase, partial [Candidatus Marinimicrobia bacterium]|nr:site-specific DNA-methyltransferase [Candidatus Neomarinimicrobiota bacterium]